MPAEKIILSSIAVRGVADDWMEYVLHVAPYLMIAARERRSLHQGKPRRGISADRIGQFNGGQSPVVRDGVLPGLFPVRFLIGHLVPAVLQGMIDTVRLGRKPA